MKYKPTSPVVTHMLSDDFFFGLDCTSCNYAASAWRFLFHHDISTNHVPQRMENGGCDVIHWPSGLFKYRFCRPTESHRQLLGISANSCQIGFNRSWGSSVVMISCSSWNLIVISSLLCLCTWTEASFYETVRTNLSYLMINIFHRKEDACSFLLPLGRSAIWWHFLTSCFFLQFPGQSESSQRRGKTR